MSGLTRAEAAAYTAPPLLDWLEGFEFWYLFVAPLTRSEGS